MSRPSLISLLALLAACATDDGVPSGVTFDDGSPDELQAAEDLAYASLWADDGAAMAAGVGELRTLKVHVDMTAMAHTKVRQLVDGVPVWQGEAIVHLTQDGKFAGVTDSLVPYIEVDTQPDYTSEEAIELAVATVEGGWADLSDDPRADLWVIRHDGADHLAWRVQLHAVSLDAHDAMPVVFIDAHTGDVVWSYDNFQSATCSGTTNFYGTVSVDCYTDGANYYLEDTTDLIGTYSWNNTTSGLYYVSSTSTTFPSSSAVYTNAIEAHYVADQVNAYYDTAHGRNGIDGAGGPAAITSHGYNFLTSTTSYSSGYVNAYWDPSNEWMVYGDGDGTNADSLTTLDVGGHEQTHGVTQYEANLTYSGESGHLNESFSDVFGAMVERSVTGETADTWTLAEEAWTPATAGDALRYLDDPAADGVSHDYYTAGIGSVDVHYGSGVGNLAFYLLSEGGSHPRGASTTVVAGIGPDDAAAIWYLALTSYMTSSTNYARARTATLSAAGALFGTASPQYTAVGDAWSAVGVTGGASFCTSTTYTGSLSRTGRSGYQPGSSGTSVTATSQTLDLSGPASADFDLYLQKKVGSRWTNVTSGTGPTSTEAVSYSGTSGTYRVRVYSFSGRGAYTLTWCK